MLAELLNRLRGGAPAAQFTAESSRVALAAVMVRLARTDGSYSGAERRRIEALLTARYGLHAGQASALRIEAEEAEREAPDTVRFTRIIKESVPYDERVGVIEALWRLAADEGFNADERGFLRLVASLIGVTDQDSGLARQRVLGDDAG